MNRAALRERMGVVLQWVGRRIPRRARAAIRRVLRPDGAVDGWELDLDRRGSIAWPVDARRRPDGRGAVVPADLRCLLVADSLDSGGVDEFVAFLTRRLPGRGIATSILLAPTQATRDRGNAFGALARRLASDGVTIIHGSDRDELVRTASAWAPDVVAVHGGATWAVRAAADAGIPVVETLHGMHNLNHDPEVGVLSRLELLDAIVAVSETVARQFTRVAPVHTRAPVVIPNGVDPDRIGLVDRDEARRVLGIDDGTLVVSLARYSLQKNSYALVSAFGDVASRSRGARLLVSGRVDDPSYAGSIVRLQRSMSHGAAVHLRSNTDRADVLLAAADCVVLDSFFEGWALASMEALGTGIPVVSSDVGGAREQLADGPRRGILVPHPLGDPLSADWDAMARARFVHQRNRGELVDAVSAVIDGSAGVASREEIAEYSIDRFRDDRCLDGHAGLLREPRAARHEETDRE